MEPVTELPAQAEMRTDDSSMPEAEYSSALRVGARMRPAVPWAVFVLGFGLFPVLFDSPYAHNVGVLICLTAVMASGWNVLGGWTGQISLGHAMFFGIGAYSTAMAGAHYQISPWLGIIAGVCLSVLVAGVVGLPVFRLRGHYFAIATIALGEVLHVVFLNWRWAGAATGLSVPLKAGDSLAALQFSGRLKWEYYYIAFALLLGVMISVFVLLRSRTGRYLTAIREDETAAASLGVPVLRYKQVAFAFSAAVVAIAGGVYTQYVLFVDPDSTFALSISIAITIAAVLGGVRSMWGPVIGAVVLTALTETTRLYLGGTGRGLNLLVYGLLIMVIAAFEPNGLIGLGKRARKLARRWLS